MKRWLKLFGIVLFTIGFVLAATYDRPNCSGIACPIAIPVFELGNHTVKNGEYINAYVLAFKGNCTGNSIVVASSSGAVRFRLKEGVYIADKAGLFEKFKVPQCIGNLTVYEFNPYLSNVLPVVISYDGRYFVFHESYTIGLKRFYMKAIGPIGFNITDMATIFPAREFRRLEVSYSNGTVRVRDLTYHREIGGIEIMPGTQVSSMTIYNDPEGYFESRNCTEHYREIVEACRASGSPEYQFSLGVGLMVLGFGLFWLGKKL
ncbi:hypothetical protein [Thermococcus prieurii]